MRCIAKNGISDSSRDCSGAYSSASGAVFDESHRLLYVDSDRLHAVCASNAGALPVLSMYHSFMSLPGNSV